MSSALRDPSLRGKRVFESRNGGYVMFIAEVDFVPDMMMNLARKAILDGASSDGRGTAAAAGDATHEGGARGRGEQQDGGPDGTQLLGPSVAPPLRLLLLLLLLSCVLFCVGHDSKTDGGSFMPPRGTNPRPHD